MVQFLAQIRVHSSLTNKARKHEHHLSTNPIPWCTGVNCVPETPKRQQSKSTRNGKIIPLSHVTDRPNIMFGCATISSRMSSIKFSCQHLLFVFALFCCLPNDSYEKVLDSADAASWKQKVGVNDNFSLLQARNWQHHRVDSATANSILARPYLRSDDTCPGLFDDESGSPLKRLVVSLLRGGYYDLINHYSTCCEQRSEHSIGVDHDNANNPSFYMFDGYHESSSFAHAHAPLPLNIPPGTWERYLRATRNDTLEARRRLTSSLRWRSEQGMDQILAAPHPHFDIIKRYYPHAFHLRGWNNEPVYYESPAKINVQALKEAGLSLENLVRHYALITEFMWTYISQYQNGPMSKGITVLDLDGMRLRDFAGDVVTFLKRAASFTSQHYPERAGTIYVLNSPPFFQVIWKIITPLLDPVTLTKVRVVESSNRDPQAVRNALLERIPLENIPREYGGQSPIPLGCSPEEQLLQELMNHNNYHIYSFSQMGMRHQGYGCQFCSYCLE